MEYDSDDAIELHGMEATLSPLGVPAASHRPKPRPAPSTEWADGGSVSIPPVPGSGSMAAALDRMQDTEEYQSVRSGMRYAMRRDVRPPHAS